MKTELTIEPTGRSVIECKLLTALTDAGTVAVLLSEYDLVMLIAALRGCPGVKAEEMANDLTKLLASAFPPQTTTKL